MDDTLRFHISICERVRLLSLTCSWEGILYIAALSQHSKHFAQLTHFASSCPVAGKTITVQRVSARVFFALFSIRVKIEEDFLSAWCGWGTIVLVKTEEAPEENHRNIFLWHSVNGCHSSSVFFRSVHCGKCHKQLLWNVLFGEMGWYVYYHRRIHLAAKNRVEFQALSQFDIACHMEM